MVPFSNFQGSSHSLPVGNVINDYFSLFVDRPSCEMIAAFSKRKTRILDLNWEDTNAEETEAYSYTW
jgi:hypothetical protein